MMRVWIAAALFLPALAGTAAQAPSASARQTAGSVTLAVGFLHEKIR